MLTKINIFKIITSHLKTLTSFKTKKASLNDWWTFLILPLIIALGLVYTFGVITDNLINLIVAILSILGGFSFNLLAIIFGYNDKIKRTIKDGDETKSIYIKQIHSNISFSILNALICILLLLVNKVQIPYFVWKMEITSYLILIVISFITYFCLTFYLFTMLMILKRISILFDKEFVEGSN